RHSSGLPAASGFHLFAGRSSIMILSLNTIGTPSASPFMRICGGDASRFTVLSTLVRTYVPGGGGRGFPACLRVLFSFAISASRFLWRMNGEAGRSRLFGHDVSEEHAGFRSEALPRSDRELRLVRNQFVENVERDNPFRTFASGLGGDSRSLR